MRRSDTTARRNASSHEADDEGQRTADIVELACQYGRYGYRKFAALLRDAGWRVNDKRVERIWRREGRRSPRSKPKRGRLWLADGSCLRLRPQHKNHTTASCGRNCRCATC